ncbi:MAG: Zn-dependent hydrolase [Woeseia sp.]|jgi:beta-ureidopropionase / N-carbamoyl-L-amino-acid hydrolase|nr:Zn-dependent hydrolase [Woeseia sp.]MBT6211485.1 Zn-dependent hydrolase [Woeseia sp.]
MHRSSELSCQVALIPAVFFSLFSVATLAQQSDLRIDGERLNATMAHVKTIGLNEDGGSDRVAYSSHNKDALAYLSELMQAAGLSTQIDVAGNLVGRREGKVAGLAPIITGSHIDTVPNGGHYDGIVGTMSGIEVARTMNDNGVELDHPFDVIVWSNEEGGKIGSRSYRGAIGADEMALQSLGDKTLGDGIAYLGGDPNRLSESQRQAGDVAALIELHIEQGAVLDREGVTIGVVEGIVGIKRWNITVEGFANHAGTTPMDQRQDAMLAAARLTIAVNDTITGTPGKQVGTVGRMQLFPGAPNVIPGKVVMSLEIRDLQMEKVSLLFEQIEAAAQQIAMKSDTSILFKQYYESPAAITDERFKTTVENSANTLGLTSMHMPSGAGHDTQSLQGLAPLGMIFVPSVKGVSHAPSEFTSAQDITNGANVLLLTIIELDKQLR